MSFWFESDYCCKPLDSLNEIQSFIDEPPIWRSLCRRLTPHSKYAIKNSEVDPKFEDISLERPLTFCHFDPDHDFVKETITLHEEKELPKLLVCHDMANGYHDDSHINGTDNMSAYTFYNWAAVDVFCYFSHHLVTVPPLAHINAAHAHGVKVIGTFITEWKDGETFWDQMFSDESNIDTLVQSLVAISKTLKFEGWLINIENKIAEPDKLLKFVRDLHTALHREVPGAELIWYDSVTKSGQLSWQNRLNELNRPFFDACDGIFTNYSWKEGDIIESAKEAGARVKDVYIGIDVWGRNFYGGGMFNTQEAVKVAYKHGCSLAVFAPAWTHEAMGDDSIFMGEHLPKHERFMIRDRALWDSLWPFFKTKLPCTLPFQTSFCRGLGNKRRRDGEVFTNGPWYNLRHMQYQPNCAHGPHGYLLSPDDYIKAVSPLAIMTKGVLKLRQSLMQFMGRNDDNKKKNDQPKSSQDYFEESDENVPISGEIKTINYEAEIILDNKISDENEVSVNNKKISEKEKINDDENMNIEDEIDTDGKKINEKTADNRVEYEMEIIGKLSNKRSTTDLDEVMDKKENMTSKIFKLKKTHEPLDADSSKSVTKRELPELSQKDLKDSDTHLGSSTRNVSIAQSITQAVNILGLKKTRYVVAYVEDEKECLQPWLGDSFNGGTCLKINPSDKTSEDHRIVRLFCCDFHIKAGAKLVVCMVTKRLPEFRSQWLNLWLQVTTESGTEILELVGRSEVDNHKDSCSSNKMYRPLDVTSDEFAQLRTYLVVHEPDFYIVPENPFGWNIWYFQVPCVSSLRVTSLLVRSGRPEGSILLGHVGLCARTQQT